MSEFENKCQADARLAILAELAQLRDGTASSNQLMPLIDRSQWADINHFLVYFGREVCDARKPACDRCEFTDICPRVDVG